MKLGAYFLCGLFLGAMPAWGEAGPAGASLSVGGEASVKVAADWVSLGLSVESAGDTAEVALERNSERMNRVRKALTKAGVEVGELATGSFTIQPQWEPRPRQADGNWKPAILGYRVHNQVRIESPKLTRVGQWIQVAVEAGANGVEQMRFSLAEPSMVKDRAMAEAIARARRSAEAAAVAAGVQLGALVDLRVDGSMPRPIIANAAPRLEAARMSMAAVPEISPGEIEVQSRVELTYGIGPVSK